MKSVALVTIVVCLSAAVNGASYGGGGGGGGGYGAAASSSSYNAPAAAPASSYSAPAQMSIPAPPCPKNYLFSCQPKLSPAPCSQAAGGYGSGGSYSHNYPVYAEPRYGYQTY